MRNPCATVPPNRVVGRPLGVDVDELLVLGHLGEGVDARLVDDEPIGNESLARAPGEVAGRDRLPARPGAHLLSPNMGGGAATPTPPSTGTIAPVV